MSNPPPPGGAFGLLWAAVGEGQDGGLLKGSPPYGIGQSSATCSDLAPEPSALLEAGLSAADAAGAIIRRYFRAQPVTERKGDESPVTIADRAAEQAMRVILAVAFPDHGLHGEEYGAERPQAPYQWVLDPIDGTRAFITGRPVFGTLIALLHEGAPILGIIDQPITGERWVGQRGQPTHFNGPFGGIPRTRCCAALAGAELSCTSPELLGPHLPAWRHLADQVARTSWGGDCYAYGLLALGCIDIIAECGLKIWDWAALLPVVEGAGGRLTDWAGQVPLPGGDGRILAVGDPSLLPLAVAALGQPL